MKLQNSLKAKYVETRCCTFEKNFVYIRCEILGSQSFQYLCTLSVHVYFIRKLPLCLSLNFLKTIPRMRLPRYLRNIPLLVQRVSKEWSTIDFGEYTKVWNFGLGIFLRLWLIGSHLLIDISSMITLGKEKSLLSIEETTMHFL